MQNLNNLTPAVFNEKCLVEFEEKITGFSCEKIFEFCFV